MGHPVQFLYRGEREWLPSARRVYIFRMANYGQFCPIAKTSEFFAERWVPLILRELLRGSTHFNDIRRGVPLMSPSLLTRRLRELEEAGVISIEPAPGGRGFEYRLTPAGLEFQPIIAQLGTWGMRWAGRRIRREDLDPRLLVWELRSCVDLDAAPPKRTVIEFHFPDAQQALRYWWLVVEHGDVDVCLEHPGGDADVSVETDVRTMVMVLMGDLSLRDAQRGGLLQLSGRRELVRAFPSLLRPSLFAGVQRVRRGDQYVKPA